VWLVTAGLLCGAVGDASGASKVILIGGEKSEGGAQHDYPNGVRVLKAMIEASPDTQGKLSVEAYPDGWPMDPAALEKAATIVIYSDGIEKHPLTDARRREQFERAMRAGTGFIALHQAITVPVGDVSINLQNWLGGARQGMFDRATEMVRLEPAAHPVSRGIDAFTYRDEFYPTVRFGSGSPALVPLLTGKLHVDFREGRHLILDQPTSSTVGWAFERPDHGRSFGYSGAHYLASFDEPALRKLLLNAILWTSRLEVPGVGARDALAADFARKAGESSRVAQGVGTPVAGTAVREAVVTRASQNEVLPQPWGQLTWYVSGALGNSTTLTVGQAVIRPGQQNPRHYHPNCDEVLRVSRGRIMHTMGDRSVEMSAGDTVSIPTGVAHNARNIGTEDAVLDISFSSADRKVVGE